MLANQDDRRGKERPAAALRQQDEPAGADAAGPIPDQPWLEPPPRRSTKGQTFETRPMRCARMPRRSVPYRFVRSHGIMPVLDVFLSSGQVRTLQYLICRTGRGHSFTTLTSWLAADLGWHVRTIQVHLRALRLQGYILTSAPDPKTHKITITLTARCEVAPPHVRKKTGPQSQDLKGGATNRSSSTDETSSLRKKGANPSAETGAAVGASAPAPASRGAPEQRAAAFLHKPLCPMRIATPPRNTRARGIRQSRRRFQRHSRPGPRQKARSCPCGARWRAGEGWPLADTGQRPRAVCGLRRAQSPTSELDAARRAAAADWAMARIRGKV